MGRGSAVVGLVFAGYWHDDFCTEEKAYVCEYDGVPADPSTWDNSGASE